MGAKDWIIMYADGDVPGVLRAKPELDRAATLELMRRLYPGASLRKTADVTLSWANPPDGTVYAACYPGLTIVCSTELAQDSPTDVPRRFRDEGRGRTVYLHAMHSVVNWAAYAIWGPDGKLVRSLSVDDNGTVEDLGEPLPFEADHPFDDEDFSPLDLGEGALRAMFGFIYEGYVRDDDVDPGTITLAAFEIRS